MHLIEANGASIPALGLGTWQLMGEECVEIVAEGLRRGYRHLDTAQMYGNEQEVGEGLRASGVKRDEVFLTTKIWPDSLAPGVLEPAAEERLKLLGVADVDLLLVHWPNREVPLKDTLAAMAAVKRAGITRHIGVSNFTVALLDEAVAVCDEPLVTNQVEYHPFIDQTRILGQCRRHGLSLTAYAPLARGRVTSDPVIREIADRRGRPPGQIALRWLVQQDGVAAIPKTGTPSRLSENLAVAEFSLDEDEMRRIAALAEPTGRVVATSWAPDWD